GHVDLRHDFHLAERVGTIGLLLRRQRRRQRIDSLGDDHAARVQFAVPEIGNVDRLFQDRGLCRRRAPLLRLRAVFPRDDDDVVRAGADGERSRDPHRARLAGRRRNEGDVLVGVVALLLVLFFILIFVLIFVLVVFLVGGFPGRRRGLRILR